MDERGMLAVNNRWWAKGSVLLQGLLGNVREAIFPATMPLTRVNVRR
jgi:hypothetical protein